MSEKEYRIRHDLLDWGLIDVRGNVTERGNDLIVLIEKELEHESALLMDLYEAEEMDLLDARCRRRPRKRTYDG